jgi:carboxymethylenebutenolidase
MSKPTQTSPVLTPDQQVLNDLWEEHRDLGPPAGRRQLRHQPVVIVQFRERKLAHQHIYWDQASLLVQLGVLDPAGLPVAGAETARKVQDPDLPSNELIRRAEARRG